MNKKWIILLVVLLIIGGVLLYFFFGRNNNQAQTPKPNYSSSRISANTTVPNENGTTSNTNNMENGITNDTKNNSDANNSISNNSTINNTTGNNSSNNQTSQGAETKISSFSTPIVDDHKNRINNIKITCSRITGTVVKSDEEFSFCEVVGQPSSEDGYKEAHAFVDGELVNAIGGGNCQVSTTIYNAAKKIDGVEITERHEHDKPVGYIEMGKDATVAYDYLDLKFKNNTNYDLKLKAYIRNNKVCVDIYKISR